MELVDEGVEFVVPGLDGCEGLVAARALGLGSDGLKLGLQILDHGGQLIVSGLNSTEVLVVSRRPGFGFDGSDLGFQVFDGGLEAVVSVGVGGLDSGLELVDGSGGFVVASAEFGERVVVPLGAVVAFDPLLQAVEGGGQLVVPLLERGEPLIHSRGLGFGFGFGFEALHEEVEVDPQLVVSPLELDEGGLAVGSLVPGGDLLDLGLKLRERLPQLALPVAEALISFGEAVGGLDQPSDLGGGLAVHSRPTLDLELVSAIAAADVPAGVLDARLQRRRAAGANHPEAQVPLDFAGRRRKRFSPRRLRRAPKVGGQGLELLIAMLAPNPFPVVLLVDLQANLATGANRREVGGRFVHGLAHCHSDGGLRKQSSNRTVRDSSHASRDYA